MLRLSDFSVDRDTYARDAETVARGFWDRVRAKLDETADLEDVVTVYYCAVDPATPMRVKAGLMAALAWFVMPARGFPRLLAGLAGMDSGSLFERALAAVRAHVREEHREKARAALARLQTRETDGDSG